MAGKRGPGLPHLRSVLTEVEHTMGDGVNATVHSEVTAIVYGMTLRVRRHVTGATDRVSRRLLRSLNLPTRMDQDRLLRQLATLEHEVRRLSDLAQDKDDAEARRVRPSRRGQ